MAEEAMMVTADIRRALFELERCGTKQTCAVAAIADAASIRFCSTNAAAIHPKSPKRSLQFGLNDSWRRHLRTGLHLLRPHVMVNRGYFKPVSKARLSFRNATKASKTIRTR